MARMKKSPLKKTMALAPAAHRAPFGKSMAVSGSSSMVLRGYMEWNLSRMATDW